MITYTLSKEAMLAYLNKKLIDLELEITQYKENQTNFLLACKKELKIIHQKLSFFTDTDYKKVADITIKKTTKNNQPNFLQRINLFPYSVYIRELEETLNPLKDYKKIVKLVKEKVDSKKSKLIFTFEDSALPRYEYYYDEFLNYFNDSVLTEALKKYSRYRIDYIKSTTYMRELTCKKEELLKELELTQLISSATFTTTSECKL